MNLHDWSGVPSVFWSFRGSWLVHLSEALNNGALSAAHYAMTWDYVNDLKTGRYVRDPHPGSDRSFTEHRLCRTVEVLSASDHRTVAQIEILTPQMKRSAAGVAEFTRKVCESVDAGVHVVVIDVLPPTRRDRGGIHAAVMKALGEAQVTRRGGRAFASYRAGPRLAVQAEQIAVGDRVPNLPLFLTPDESVELPLAATYAAAYRGVPGCWKEAIERNP
jgi:hypothetical protein